MLVLLANLIVNSINEPYGIQIPLYDTFKYFFFFVLVAPDDYITMTYQFFIHICLSE